MASRTYLVGLPVTVTVHEDGRVVYRVDTGEASVAIWDDDDCGYTDEHRQADAEAIDIDHARRRRRDWPEFSQEDN